MPKTYLPRTLRYEKEDKAIDVRQEYLLQLTQPLVILGEAGMGKSRLLQWVVTAPGYSLCTARQLINRANPRSLLGESQVLVIDALDEVSAAKEGDAVNLVLRRLGELDYPRFVLACRAVDWRSATGVEAIREQYDQSPLELNLNPFSEAEVSKFLEHELGSEKSSAIVAHFENLGLGGLLGNPQTLALIIPSIAGGALPQTRSELFELAVTQMLLEHNVSKAGTQLSQEAALNGAGAAFAALLLSGSEVINRGQSQNLDGGELSLPELCGMPSGENAAALLGSRLFCTAGTDRFSYWHRRIAEYLGARYLARQANTPRKRRRMLALFQSHGLVPASLRGLHAWLALDPALAPAVISADPMGLIEYGDVDNLLPSQARTLLQALKRLADTNPDFRPWRSRIVRGLASPHLIDEIRHLVTTDAEPFGLRLLILESIPHTPIVPLLLSELLALIQSPEGIFALRRAAAEALIGHISDEDWAKIFKVLRDWDDELSLRLALELMDQVGYAPFDDRLIAELVQKYAIKDGRTARPFYLLEMNLPDNRLESFLDHFAATSTRFSASLEASDYENKAELSDFAYRLIARRLHCGPLDPQSLWRWLSPFDLSDGFDKEPRQQLQDYLTTNTNLRQAVQRMVILDRADGKSAWHRYMELQRKSSGFFCTEGDALALLAVLDPMDRHDDSWRDIVQLVAHDQSHGAEVRHAAKPFARKQSDLLDWIDKLATPSVHQWQIEQEEWRTARRQELAKRHLEHREHFFARKNLMIEGRYGVIVGPALVYLKLYADIRTDVPAHERITQWLGEELARAAHLGFEAFLKQLPPVPSAEDIAQSYAKGKEYKAGYIIIAALAERLRNGIGIDDLNEERLMAALFVVKSTRVDQHADIARLELLLTSELQNRGHWSSAVRMLMEPQIRAAREHVTGLHDLMHDSSQAPLANELALEWLQRYTTLPDQVENLLIDRLLNAHRHHELRLLCTARECVRESQQRNWDAVGLIVDFEETATRLSKSTIAPELLWAIRDRSGSRRHRSSAEDTTLSPAQLEWIITTFRGLWVYTPPPLSGWGGDTNAWDASDYLRQLMNRLGNDSSLLACKAMARLRDAPLDGYTNALFIACAEQARIRVEATYAPSSMASIAAVISNHLPSTAQDLQTWMLEELNVVQAKIRSDDAESWRGFYGDAMRPHPEEHCRDHLLGLLRQGSAEVSYEPETHIANDKEVDIACCVGALRLPIEIKGQWHRQLWEGADSQLDQLYTPDWRAGGYGIYLVLWFGETVPTNKRLVCPAGSPRPSSPQELQRVLVECSQASREGRVAVMVLDVSRS
ncbi:hypothetical protein [Pseudomonas aeruginosa]